MPFRKCPGIIREKGVTPRCTNRIYGDAPLCFACMEKQLLANKTGCEVWTHTKTVQECEDGAPRATKDEMYRGG